jgi:SNF2 family DNA or RNA helicase
VLLTATPLQNSLMELYGLVSILDDKVFLDEKTFRERFVSRDDHGRRDEELRRAFAPSYGAPCARRCRSTSATPSGSRSR